MSLDTIFKESKCQVVGRTNNHAQHIQRSCEENCPKVVDTFSYLQNSTILTWCKKNDFVKKKGGEVRFILVIVLLSVIPPL